MTVEFLQLLILIIIANGAPILIRVLLHDKFAYAVDFQCKLPDDKPLFGSSKTWRGVFASLLATSAAAWLFGYPSQTGFLVALYVIAGDLISSFIKRRMALAPSSPAFFLDQVPESLIPSYLMRQQFNLEISSVILLVLIFIMINLTTSQVLYSLGIRKRPY